MPAKQKFKDYETAVARLEEITDKLESGDESLESSIELYSEGLEIAKFCTDKLGEVQKKIKIITEKAGVESEEDFELNEGNG